MRVVHIVTHDGKNGVVTSCLRLAEAQLRRGHEIMLVTRTGGWMAQQPLAKSVAIVESHLRTEPREFIRVGEIIRAWEPTVIHCHGSRANKYGLVFRVAAGAPVLTTAHSRKIQIPFALMRAVIAPSSQTARFHRRYNLVPASKLTLIPYLFTDFAPAGTAKQAYRAEFDIGDDEFVIGMVGAIDARKNQIDALRILEKVGERFPGCRLVIVGNYRRRREPMPGWDAQMARPGVAARVILTGHREDAIGLQEFFDLFLCTSKLEEGPIAVLEAMALAKPVVSTAIGMVPDLIRDGTDGFVVRPGDVDGAAEAICRLIGDVDLRDRIGRQGRARFMEICDEEAILRRTDEVYERVARAAGTWTGAWTGSSA